MMTPRPLAIRPSSRARNANPPPVSRHRSVKHPMARTLYRASRRRTHLGLLALISALVLGTAVWLKLSLEGEHPYWAYVSDDRSQIHDFDLDVQWDQCDFKTTEEAGEGLGCDGEGTAMVTVTAMFERVLHALPHARE